MTQENAKILVTEMMKIKRDKNKALLIKLTFAEGIALLSTIGSVAVASKVGLDRGTIESLQHTGMLINSVSISTFFNMFIPALNSYKLNKNAVKKTESLEKPDPNIDYVGLFDEALQNEDEEAKEVDKTYGRV